MRYAPKVLLALGILAGQLPAQEPETPVSDPTLIDSILEEMETLESPAEYGSQGSFVGIHGFFDLEFKNGDNQGSSFDLHHANLLFDVALAQDTDVRLEFEWEHGGDSVEVDQAFFDYHPFETPLALIFGRFYAPFGRERFHWYPPASKTASRPFAFREVVPGNWYETGFMVKWQDQTNAPQFTAEAAISNGLGDVLDTTVRDARQTRNNNQSVMLSGRLGFLHEAFEAGVSFANGKYDDQGQNGYQYLGADFATAFADCELSGEWVSSTVDDPTATGGDFIRDGWYLLAYYPVLTDEHDVGVFARFDRVDPDSRVRDADDRSAAILGLRWAPTERITFKFEYQNVQFSAAGNWPGEDLFLVQAVLDF
jgi:hypothetical protein